MAPCKAKEEARWQGKAERGRAGDRERLPEPLPGICEDIRLARTANAVRRARLLLARQRGQGNASVVRACIAPPRRLQRADGEGQAPALPEVRRLELPTPALLGPRPEPFAHIRVEVPPLTLRALE
ncbi:MAG: hypothetical protein ACP5SI_06960, partial [Chloroflexia bacterium]